MINGTVRNSADRDRLFAALRSYLGRGQTTPQTALTSLVDNADLIGTQERIARAMFLSLFAVRRLSGPLGSLGAHLSTLTCVCVVGYRHSSRRSGTISLSPKYRSRTTPPHYDCNVPDNRGCVERRIGDSVYLARHGPGDFPMAPAYHSVVLEDLERPAGGSRRSHRLCGRSHSLRSSQLSNV